MASFHKSNRARFLWKQWKRLLGFCFGFCFFPSWNTRWTQWLPLRTHLICKTRTLKHLTPSGRWDPHTEAGTCKWKPGWETSRSTAPCECLSRTHIPGHTEWQLGKQKANWHACLITTARVPIFGECACGEIHTMKCSRDGTLPSAATRGTWDTAVLQKLPVGLIFNGPAIANQLRMLLFLCTRKHTRVWKGESLWEAP